MFFIVFLIKNYESGNNMHTTEPTASAKNLDEYVLKEYNGSIAVFYSGSKSPIEVFDVDVFSLPEEDQQMLSQGITAATAQELQSLIEDYTS
jgi:hypothetical protein